MGCDVSRRALLASALATCAPLSLAQAFPDRPIRLLVGFAAGGGVDALARVLSLRLSEPLGQQVVVENRTGAAGMIAAETVARSPADGYTLLMGASGLLIAPHLQARSSIEPLKALLPVAGAFVVPLMIVVNNDLKVRNPKELIALLRANPGRFSYASAGVGSAHHLAFEMFKSRTHTFAVHVPYRGAGQIVPDVISGHVPIGVVSVAAGMAQARSGRLRAVALMNTGSVPGAEDVPALADAVPGFNVAPRVMLLAPAGTPGAVIDRLSEAVRTVLAEPAVVQAAAHQGAFPAYLPPAVLAVEMARESQSWASIISTQKISAQS
jgi:tripartite-type tricarboxylate transporter receptor subunit TctC